MDSQLQAALLTVALTLIGGALGYAFREYINRAKPFTAIMKVGGDFRAGRTVVDIPKEVPLTLEAAFYINRLDLTDTLDDVWKSWNDSENIVREAGNLLSLIDQVIRSTSTQDKDALLSSLSKIISRRDYERWIMILIGKGKLNIPAVDEDLPVVVPSRYAPDSEGCVWIAFPGAPTTFGFSFEKNPMLRDMCQPFIALIERLDMEALNKVFRQIKEHVKAELMIAKDVGPKLEQIHDENSRWEVQIYMANLGKSPLLVGTEGTLHVKDETGARFEENCMLVLLLKDDDGSVKRVKTESPLVLQSESSAQFAYFTNSTQKDMNRGKAFRGAFSSDPGKSWAQCWVEFGIQKVGIIRHKKLRTPKVPFQSMSQ